MKGAGANSPPWFPRSALAREILHRPEPIVVLSAPPGMGKSCLMKILATRKGLAVHRGPEPPAETGGRLVLWDLPIDALPTKGLAAATEASQVASVRLVIAKRPEQTAPGLDRAAAYGGVHHVGADRLRLSEEELAAALGEAAARALLAKTWGWPALVAACLGADRSERDAAAYCFRELCAGYDDRDLAALDVRAFAPPQLRPIALEALRAEVDQRACERGRARALAEAFESTGHADEAVRLRQKFAMQEDALAAFVRAGGWAFIFRYGPAAFDAALAGFEQPLLRHSEALVLALAFQALKRGELSRAKRLFTDRFGPSSDDPARIFGRDSRFSTAVRGFYFAMMLYERSTPGAELLQQAFATLDDMPCEAHMQRGNFYNAALEFYIRENRFAEAEDLAQRSLDHYERTGVAILCFYICAHRTLISLNMGDVVAARRHCDEGGGWLAKTPFDSPGDARILALLNACVAYEGGRPENLLTFLLEDVDRFASGETWPTLVDLLVRYGAQALSEHYSCHAALAFLDRWRVNGLKSPALMRSIELRAATVLQHANRWDDAEAALAASGVRLSAERLLGGTVDLRGLREPEALDAALTWMRQLAFRSTKAPGLERRLMALRENLALPPRQRVVVDLWLAHVWRTPRDFGRARAALKAIFEWAARTGSLATLAGERVFVAELIAQRKLTKFIETSPLARQTLRKLRDTGLAAAARGARVGLTRQETRVLILIGRGATNKDAAKSLGVSEATIKFHLGNAYRKLGCRRRSEAVAAAHALDFFS